MKEYLTKNSNGQYQLVNHRFSEDDIEVPVGAIGLTKVDDIYIFWFEDGLICGKGCEKYEPMHLNFGDYLSDVDGSILLWQRCTQPEELPFIDDEPKKHSHYFKDVSDLNEIDVYQVLRLFNVTDPCLQHIVKKALCAGQRGHKDFETDLKNIFDTAKRALEINNVE